MAALAALLVAAPAATAQAPALEVERDGEVFVFPTIAPSDPAAEERITLTNFGDLPAIVSPPVLEGDAAFRVDGSGCAAPLEAFESCELILHFDPTGPGSHSGRLEINSNDEFSPHTVWLRGTGSGSRLSFRRSTGFGAVQVGQPVQRQVPLWNMGPDPAAVSLQITGPDAASYRVYSNGCAALLPSGSTCQVGVELTATRVGRHTATLEASAPSAPTAASFSLSTTVGVVSRPMPLPAPRVDPGRQMARTLINGSRAWRKIGRRALRRRGFAATFKAPGPGTVRLELRRAGNLVARGTSDTSAGSVTVRARATRFGRRLLKVRRPLTLTARLVFTPTTGVRSVTVRTVRLRAPGG